MALSFRPFSRGLVVALAVAAAPARGAIPPDQAMAIFQEAQGICARDAGALWGRGLCGPMLLVDPNDLTIVANQADAGGVLKPSGPIFIGNLPPSEILANTPVEWSGTRWTELLWPLPDEPDHQHVMLAHELFHRIQPEVGMIRPDGGNQHLDTLEGRYLLQLEWRALAKALPAPAAAGRRSAVADALRFRHERYRLFPEAGAEDAALEVNEGVPEYTGVKLGLTTPQARTAYALRDLSAFLRAPTFVRSFAYATDPAYGLLLDRADPAWLGKVRGGQRLDQVLGAALRLPPSAAGDVMARAAVYDDGTLRTREVAREAARQARLAALRARFVDGPVLILPLHHMSYQFNPQTLLPLGGAGTIFPTLKVTADFGVLEVDGGALLDKAMTVAAVSAAGFDPSNLKGEGWKLTLKPGWSIEPGPRQGDLMAKPAP
jgi:hypothetical protein